MTIKLFRPIPPYYIGSQDNSDTVVLFIHGLGGSFWTWSRFAKHLKNEWVEIDSFAIAYDEYYDVQSWINRIPILKRLLMIRKIFAGPGIEKLSLHLNSVVLEVCNKYENVIIIAHSMGGLVARKYLVDLIEETKSLGKIRALITYATPHKGSKWATLYLKLCYNFFRYFTKDSEQLSQLSSTGAFLVDLNERWRNYNIDDKIDYYRVYGMNDWVVDAESSAHFKDPKVRPIANKNHFNIITPYRKNDAAFLVSYNYLKDFRKGFEAKKEMLDENEFRESDDAYSEIN